MVKLFNFNKLNSLEDSLQPKKGHNLESVINHDIYSMVRIYFQKPHILKRFYK
jgi:hypothetical protein